MQSVYVGTTVRVGNHTMTAAETAAGAPVRLPFVDGADPPAPIDPDVVTITLTTPNRETFVFTYPEAGPTDAGVPVKEETGRFYVDWTPVADEDGLWTWSLTGAMVLGTGRTDQGPFFVDRAITPGP